MLGTLDVTVLDPEASDAQTKYVLKYSVLCEASWKRQCLPGSAVSWLDGQAVLP